MFVPEHPIKHLKTFQNVRWNFVECSRIQKVLKVFCETFQNVELEQVTMFIDKLSKKHFRMFWRKCSIGTFKLVPLEKNV